MNTYVLGIVAGLSAAVLWSLTSLCFERAGRAMGSLMLNLVRLLIALVFFVILSFIRTGYPLDPAMDLRGWIWLSASGLLGFVLGDLFLFKAFLLIGSRLTMLIYASVPPITALAAWLFLGESISGFGLGGMALVLSGIVLAVLDEKNPGNPVPHNKNLSDRHRGFIYALGASLAQAGGLLLSKYGAGSHDSFTATEVRVLAAILGFALLISIMGRWQGFTKLFSHAPGIKKAWSLAALGSLLGPFLGVSFGLFSTQATGAGLSSTLMSLTPLIIIAPSALIFKEPIKARDVLGAILASMGVGLMFIT